MDKDREIFLIRHLATSMNKSGIYMGRAHDPEILSEEIPNFLKRIDYLKGRVDSTRPACYSSPSVRCLRTMELVKAELGIDVETQKEPAFLETDFGEAGGLTVKEIKDRYPNVFSAWISDQSRVVFPSGETYQDVQLRAWKRLQEILEGSRDFSSILICTHVDVIKMILFKALNVPISSKPLLVIPNGSVCTFYITEDRIKPSGIFT